VFSEGSTWTQRHRAWLARQQFEHVESELAFGDYLATVDAAAARKAALAERLSRLALEPDLWPTVARLRAFRGIDTLTALGLHLELGGDWAREPASERTALNGMADLDLDDIQGLIVRGYASPPRAISLISEHVDQALAARDLSVFATPGRCFSPRSSTGPRGYSAGLASIASRLFDGEKQPSRHAAE